MVPLCNSSVMEPQTAAEKAVAAVGCGYDLTGDIRLSRCKAGSSGSRLIALDDAGACRDLAVPGGVVVGGVPKGIRCDKGERTRFRSDVLAFHQMSEHFNQELSLSGKIPSGLFNAVFNFRGMWREDASATKGLAFDGWFIMLYRIELAKSQIVLCDSVKQDVPSTWDPVALAEFIEKYGTHIITGVKMGGKDVFHLKQLHSSPLQPSEMQTLLKKIADGSFSQDTNGRHSLNPNELQRKLKEYHGAALKSMRPSIIPHSKNEDLVSIHVRRGGFDFNQTHNDWLSTISVAPDVISMSFVPISSLLNGVHGSGFLIHALNLYLRYKPPMEELQQFLEFQLPRQWAPVFSDLPLGPQHWKQSFPSLQFTLMGPKLHINTAQVHSRNRPVTGIRLYLEGKKNDCLAIHLQHLTALPDTLQISEDNYYDPYNDISNAKDYYEPVRWSWFSHVCTAPIQYTGARIDDCASIVTKAWLEVKDIDVRKVLFLRLGFSTVASAKIRRSEWDGPSRISRKSGSFSAFLGSRFSTGQIPLPQLPKVDMNSAIYPSGPSVPIRMPKMSKFIDTTETMRGPEALPGYWTVTGAKLSVEDGKISVKAKYSLLTIISEEDI